MVKFNGTTKSQLHLKILEEYFVPFNVTQNSQFGIFSSCTKCVFNQRNPYCKILTFIHLECPGKNSLGLFRKFFP